MKVTHEVIDSIKQAVQVEVSTEQIEQSREKAYKRISKELKVPGFRQGKIPPKVVEERLGKEADQEVMQQVVRDTYPLAIQEVKARPISDPRIEEVDPLEKGKPWSYKALFEVFPEVKVEKYTGLKLEQEKIDVEEDEIGVELKNLQQRMTQLEPSEGSIEEGMVALVDFVGTADGKQFEGSHAKDFVVDFGGGNLLKDFEEQIRGMKAGERKKISFTYQDDHVNKEVAGKKGDFDVTVKEIRKKIIPEIDDEFAKSLGNFENLSALRADIQKHLVIVAKETARRRLHRQVVEALAAQQPIEVPEVMITSELRSMYEGLQRQLEQQQGQTLEQIGITPEKFVKQNHDEALLRTRGFLLVNAIAKEEKITVTPEELDQHLKAIASQSRESEANVRKHFEQKGLLSQVEGEIVMEKALDFVVEKAKIKTVKAKK